MTETSRNQRPSMVLVRPDSMRRCWTRYGTQSGLRILTRPPTGAEYQESHLTWSPLDQFCASQLYYRCHDGIELQCLDMERDDRTFCTARDSSQRNLFD